MLARHVEDQKSAKQYLSFSFSPPPPVPTPFPSASLLHPHRAGFSCPLFHRSSGDVLVTDCARSGLWIYLDKWQLDIGIAAYLRDEDRVALNYKRVYGF